MSTRHALLSVSDKSGIVELGRGLVGAGFTLLSTGGTAQALEDAGLPVVRVSEHTGHAEIMDGRVKTLHPRIHGGILGLRDTHAAEAASLGIPFIDLVACNLYPFEATVLRPGISRAEAVEQIDIGGPSMIRSAAKNHRDVTVVVDPADYPEVVTAVTRDGSPSFEHRQRLALKAFRHTAAYDSVISAWLARGLSDDTLPAEDARALRQHQVLRYGENPHQEASFYADPLPRGRSLARAEQLQGKALSFNNLADLDGALRAAFELDEPGCVVVKHMNPCGAATHPDGMAAAFELALSADPVSAFGGIIAFNRPVDAEAVRALRRARTFFEVVAAPGFSDEARELIAPRAKMRVLSLPADWQQSRPDGQDARRVQGGWLVQDWDVDQPVGWEVPTSRSPDPAEAAALRFAWRVCRSVKSNAIVLARAQGGGMVLNGVGAGQMSRVDAVRLALSKARRDVEGSVLASDAFFPFPDGVWAALSAGVRAFIQPGGSIRDADVVRAVDSAEGTMVFTGARHFRH